MSRSSTLFLVLTLLVIGAAVVAAQEPPPPPPPPLILEYHPPVGQVDHRQLQVTIPEVLLTDVPTGTTASAAGVCRWTVTGVAPEGGPTSLKQEMLQITQALGGKPIRTALPTAVVLKIDAHATPVGFTPADGGQQAQGEVLSQGGLPLQVVAVLCAVPQLPPGPIAVGTTWEEQYNFTVPGLGQVALQASTTLVQVQDGLALLKSKLHAAVPEFEAENPLQPGKRMQIRGMVIDSPEFNQEYELQRSLVRRAWGPMETTFEATSEDVLLPLKVKAIVKYWEWKPPAPPQGTQ